MPGTERRADVERIQAAAAAVRKFNTEQANNLNEYNAIHKRLAANWTSAKGAAELASKTAIITKASADMQQALEDMQKSLNKYAAKMADAAHASGNAVADVDVPAASGGRSYSIG